MPSGAGGNPPNPDKIDRDLRRLTEEIGKSRIKEPSALERMAAAREAEKQARRKKDSRSLALLLIVAVVIVGGGVFAWLRYAPPSRHHRAAAGATASARPTPKTSPRSRPARGSSPPLSR